MLLLCSNPLSEGAAHLSQTNVVTDLGSSLALPTLFPTGFRFSPVTSDVR